MVKKRVDSKKEAPVVEDIEDVSNSKAHVNVNEITSTLLSWYDANHRELPWRKNPEQSHVKKQEEEEENNDKNQRAYRVWISEIMLQQTRIATVIDYYEKWMKNFPSVESLANSDLEKVHSVWSGLGYYRRADNIHKTAKRIVSEMNGQFPKTSQKLMELPGIGRYTAGAIASIVFEENAPVVDGNVLRLFSRLFMIHSDISKQKNCNVDFWPMAEQFVQSVDGGRAGDLNQSLMEMGAIVCTPKNPKCKDCCLQSQCLAYNAVQKSEAASVEIWPVKSKKKDKAKRTVAVCVVVNKQQEQEDEYLIMKNPSSGLLANLYQFPSVNISEETKDSEVEKLLCNYMKTSLHMDESSLRLQYCGDVQHVFTHIDMQLKVYTTTTQQPERQQSNDSNDVVVAFATESGFDQYGIPTVVRKVLEQYKLFQTNPKLALKTSKSDEKKKKKKNTKVPKTKTATTAKKRKRAVVESDDDDEELVRRVGPTTRSVQRKLTDMMMTMVNK